MNHKKLILLLLPLFLAGSLSAKLTMSSIFGDNMVLQRNTTVAIYGTAEANKRVTVRVNWNKETYRTRAAQANGESMCLPVTPPRDNG